MLRAALRAVVRAPLAEGHGAKYPRKGGLEAEPGGEGEPSGEGAEAGAEGEPGERS